jgi:hypothetical protein
MQHGGAKAIERRDKRAKTKVLNFEQKGLYSHGYDSHVSIAQPPCALTSIHPVKEGERQPPEIIQLKGKYWW